MALSPHVKPPKDNNGYKETPIAVVKSCMYIRLFTSTFLIICLHFFVPKNVRLMQNSESGKIFMPLKESIDIYNALRSKNKSMPELTKVNMELALSELFQSEISIIQNEEDQTGLLVGLHHNNAIVKMVKQQKPRKGEMFLADTPIQTFEGSEVVPESF